MRKLLSTICLMILAAVALSGASYSVKDIPNVHLADSTRFVSDPDGVMTDAGRAEADNRLRALMRGTTAEFVVVTVDDIESGMDENEFATGLFREWGLGKKDTNNGLLLLVVKDRRKVVFRTGGGLEGLLPDGVCGSIIRREIAPRFRAGDYDGGINAAISAVSEILASPEGSDEIRSKYANNAASSGKDFDLFKFYLWICAGIAAAMLLALVVTLVRNASRSRYDKYQAVNSLYTPALLASFIGLGIPLVALIPILLIRHRLRRGPHNCPACDSRMKLVDEEHDNDFLNSGQDMEERIGAVDYDVWLCPSCNQTEIIPYVQRSSTFTECPVCHSRTMRVVSDRIVIRPTTASTGLRVVTRQCMHCGHTDDTNHTIPRVAPPPVVIVGGGGRPGGGMGGFGGGSFGGGFTAGGGASGGW